MITKDQVLDAQEKWGNGVVKIGSLKAQRNDCEDFASSFLDERYAFEAGIVLFKPTKCELKQFRPTKAEALSYFIAGEDRVCKEDKGFAIQPWTKVRFENTGVILEENRAIAMGNYYFLNAQMVTELKIEFSVVYKKDLSGVLKMVLHDSHLPYQK